MKYLACAGHYSRMRRPLAIIALAIVALAPAAAPSVRADEDADRARDAVVAGRYVPREEIIEDATSRYPGRVVEVELDDDEYEVEILLSDGVKVELEYDARTGELLEVHFDD